MKTLPKEIGGKMYLEHLVGDQQLAQLELEREVSSRVATSKLVLTLADKAAGKYQ